MRFVLVDKRRRRFEVQRWVFRARRDGCTSAAAQAPLPEVARRYLPHLNKESFFELF